MTLKALALNCTLKVGKERSSTDRLLEEVLEALREFDVDGEILRVGNHNVKPGVKFAVTYWVGEAIGDKNYIDLKRTPRNVSDATKMLAANTSHLAHMLKAQGYPGKKS